LFYFYCFVRLISEKLCRNRLLSKRQTA
jgi:hypothetical protein